MTPKKSENTRRLHNGDAFKAEVKRWSEKINIKPRQLRIQTMKKKWASCSSRGRVCFSSDDSGSIVKWRKLGPVRLWQVDKKHHNDQGETITVKMNIPSVLITLQSLDNEPGN